MVESKPFYPPEDKVSNNSTDRNNDQSSNTMKYSGKKPQNKPSLEPKEKTNLKVRWNYLERYIFDLGLRASKKFSGTMKELEWYLGATYIDIWQPAIMNKTPDTFPNPDILTIIPDSGIERHKKDTYMNYLEKKNIDKSMWQKLRKKYVYKSYIQKSTISL